MKITGCCLIIFFLITLITSVQAQLCQGSLGDPVVNITFGTGTNPGSQLSSKITNYYYVSSCPGDGYYTVGSSSPGCFNNTWHSLTEDHTPNDANGYMMIVNASFSPGDFYVDTIKGLCGGTTYEFAAWILNIRKSLPCNGTTVYPDVTFNIETLSGTVLKSFKTGSIPEQSTLQWKQYGSFFSTLAGASSVVVRMTNNSQGGCGNDLVLDDITFRPCGPQVSATISGGQTLKDVCIGDSSIFSFTGNISTGYNNPSYQWQLSKDNGITWNDIAGAISAAYTRQPTSPGSYLYRLAVAEGNNVSISSCRIVSNSITININSKPAPAAANTSPKCQGETLTLTASNGAQYSWTGPNNFTGNGQTVQLPNVRKADSGTYYVTVTSDKGCINTDSTVVKVLEPVVANAGADTTICEGKRTTLQGSGGGSYVWLPSLALSNINTANPVASPVDTTLYILTVSNGACKAYDTVKINVLKKPVANAGPDQRIFQGQSTTLNGIAAGTNISYYWTPNASISNSADMHPVVSPSADTTYTLHVTSNAGCGDAADNVFVRVFKKVVIPNAFSPNNDGINDVWNIEGLDTYPESETSIFNRYGQLVFTSRGYSKPWNGSYNNSPLPVGACYYIINLKNEIPKLSGWVMILK